MNPQSRFKRNRPEEGQLTNPNASEKKRELIVTPIDQELHIDDRALNQELIDQPLRFKKYTQELSKLQRRSKSVKNQLEQARSRAIVKYSADGTGKKVKEVEAAVILDADVMRLEAELIEAEGLVDDYKGIVQSFYQRHEMLKDLCANKRKELLD